MTEWLCLVSFLIFALLSILFSIHIGLGLINPFSIFFLVWSALIGSYLALSPVLSLIPLGLKTWALILVGCVSFSMGGFLAILLVSGKHAKRTNSVSYNERLLIRFFSIGLCMNIVGAGLTMLKTWPMLNALGGWRAIFSGSGLTVRLGLLQSSQVEQGGFSSGGVIEGLLHYFLFVSTMTVFWGAYLVLQRRVLLGIFPLILVAFQGLITLQRSHFVYALLMFVFSYYYHALISTKSTRDRLSRARTRRKKNSSLKAFLAITVPLMLYLPIKWRHPNLMMSEILASMGQYFFGPLGGLNSYMSSTSHSLSQLEWGKWTFWGFASILYRMGLPMELPPYHMDYTQIGGNLVTNVYTFVIFPFLDWGWLGVIVLLWFLGFAATFLSYQVKFRSKLVYVPLLSIGMTTIAMSFYGMSTLRDARYAILAITSLVIGRCVVSKPQKVCLQESVPGSGQSRCVSL